MKAWENERRLISDRTRKWEGRGSTHSNEGPDESKNDPESERFDSKDDARSEEREGDELNTGGERVSLRDASRLCLNEWCCDMWRNPQ